MALPENTAATRGGGKYNVGGNIVAFGGGGYDYTGPGGRIHFNAGMFVDAILDKIDERMEAAGEVFVEAAKANFVFAYPPHSMPWDFPHYNEGGESMKDAIRAEVFRSGYDMVLQMGIIDDDLPGRMNLYPVFLETGTRFMAPRPWLTITLDETWDTLGEIMTGMGTL